MGGYILVNVANFIGCVYEVMGMPIDEVIRRIDEYNYKFQGKICPSEGLNMIVEIIQKYQKIEEIIKEHDTDNMPEDYWYIDRIREVLEDGNNT